MIERVCLCKVYVRQDIHVNCASQRKTALYTSFFLLTFEKNKVMIYPLFFLLSFSPKGEKSYSREEGRWEKEPATRCASSVTLWNVNTSTTTFLWKCGHNVYHFFQTTYDSQVGKQFHSQFCVVVRG